MTIKEILKKFDFSEKEIDVYLALLDLGFSVVSDIAEKTEINRSTVYVILDSLTKRGLVSIAEHRGVKMYNSIPPEQLVKHFEDVAKQYKELSGLAKELLPKMKAENKIKKSGPAVRFFEGPEGMKTVYEDALSSLETIRAYASNRKDDKITPENYYDRLTKKNIKVKLLLPETAEARELIEREQGKQAVNFSPNISIYDNKVVLMAPAENFALIIESKELSDSLKKAFDLSWQDVKQIDKKMELSFA